MSVTFEQLAVIPPIVLVSFPDPPRKNQERVWQHVRQHGVCVGYIPAPIRLQNSDTSRSIADVQTHHYTVTIMMVTMMVTIMMASVCLSVFPGGFGNETMIVRVGQSVDYAFSISRDVVHPWQRCHPPRFQV